MSQFLSDKDFELFSSLVYNESGIHFTNTNRSILESRLKDRLKKLGLENCDTYYKQLKNDEDELKNLLDSVTTNLTRFFRNTGHFQAFQNYVLPKLLSYKRKIGENQFKLWSAGCATGEEPYSVAIAMKEHLPSDVEIQILGSDLSLSSLMVAKEGYYPVARCKDIPEAYLKKYFSEKREGYQIKPEIRELIKFDYHNLKFGSEVQSMDIIFCRNVIIYFDQQAQKNAILKFWNSLKNYSFLFIGHSESLFGMNTQFKFIKTEWSTLYSKNLTNEEL
ncbi:MAG: protein-glutamate O-methyltransferase CheR [Spirochaetales bacterium]|nr:protein-glutamate O-methyltransferase CheR [Spirochaetales bacterium]